MLNVKYIIQYSTIFFMELSELIFILKKQTDCSIREKLLREFKSEFVNKPDFIDMVISFGRFETIKEILFGLDKDSIKLIVKISCIYGLFTIFKHFFNIYTSISDDDILSDCLNYLNHHINWVNGFIYQISKDNKELIRMYLINYTIKKYGPRRQYNFSFTYDRSSKTIYYMYDEKYLTELSLQQLAFIYVDDIDIDILNYPILRDIRYDIKSLYIYSLTDRFNRLLKIRNCSVFDLIKNPMLLTERSGNDGFNHVHMHRIDSHHRYTHANKNPVLNNKKYSYENVPNERYFINLHPEKEILNINDSVDEYGFINAKRIQFTNADDVEVE